MSDVQFGWRVPAFPVDESRRMTFINQITNTLQKIDGKFDAFWIADHFVPWADFVPDDVDTLECWTSLSYLAAAFPRFRFGSIVMSQAYRNPALVAKAAATLQLLSGGRLILGLGAGWKEDEYRAYHYDFPSAGVRIRQLDEAVQIIRKMWTEAPANFAGNYYQITDAYCEPRPDPMPPILIGGGGEQLTLRVVAERADWWNLGGSLEEYGHKLDVLRSHCDAIGRNYDDILKTWGGEGIVIAENEAAARKISTPFGLSMDAEICTPDRIAEHLHKYVELGVKHFILRFADFPNTAGVELFANEVIPQFR
jgi:alkanesulfonate monooxygenase SsuD/methylene tetrahydromethanopterin reductase-like flavin-dependent oxidoreductase (luciferase family)